MAKDEPYGEARIKLAVKDGRHIHAVRRCARDLIAATTVREWFRSVDDLKRAALPFLRYDVLPARPTPGRRREVLERDGHRCTACGETNVRLLEIDHLYPAQLGGSVQAWNLTTLCIACNREKGAGVVAWAMLLMTEQMLAVHRIEQGR